MVRHQLTTLIGKSVKSLARLRGGGSALPGLVVEKIDPHFIQRTLSQLPRGVVIISGTNGKTTTTKIAVELLQSAGLKVFTNRTGSNFSRGVAAALLSDIDTRGRLHADIAVLELDEAWAARFVRLVQPRYSLILNVMRDQLDRFGEIDTTADFLRSIVTTTTDTTVLNKDDKRVFNLRSAASCNVAYFGTTTDILQLMPTDDSLKTGDAISNETVSAEVCLVEATETSATFELDNNQSTVNMQLAGSYNLLNAAAALSLVRKIIPDTPKEALLAALSTVQPAFGRGETIMYRSTPIDLILVKNPSGFRLSLLSFTNTNAQTMIAINDNYADGRDMSWLWDVDFSKLKNVNIVSGVRAYDMALRLQYDDVQTEIIEPDLRTALEQFINNDPKTPKRIFCSYTAMTTLRKILAEKTTVEEIV